MRLPRRLRKYGPWAGAAAAGAAVGWTLTVMSPWLGLTALAASAGLWWHDRQKGN